MNVGVEIISFKNRDDKDIIDIQANIYCEKSTHKGHFDRKRKYA